MITFYSCFDVGADILSAPLFVFVVGAGILSAPLFVFPQASIGLGSCLLSGGRRVVTMCSGPRQLFQPLKGDVTFRRFQKSGLIDRPAGIGWYLGLGQVTAGSPERLYKGQASFNHAQSTFGFCCDQ